MKGKREFARNAENILKLKKCKLTILRRGVKAARLSQRTVKCSAQIATAARATYKFKRLSHYTADAFYKSIIFPCNNTEVPPVK